MNRAENSGIGADTQRESQNTNCGDGRIAQELPKAEAKVKEKIFQPSSESVHAGTPDTARNFE